MGRVHRSPWKQYLKEGWLPPDKGKVFGIRYDPFAWAKRLRQEGSYAIADQNPTVIKRSGFPGHGTEKRGWWGRGAAMVSRAVATVRGRIRRRILG